MSLQKLFHTGPIPQDVVQGSYYNYPLLVLSYCIAVLASYVAFDMVSRLRSEQKKKVKILWLFGGSIAMGAGIWSMNFIGMLALIMPISVSYDLYWTIFSLLIAILTSAVALVLLHKENRPAVAIIIGGLILGLGIATMHYSGMEGMRRVKITYLPELFLLSIALSILTSEGALWMVWHSNKGSFVRQFFLRILSACILGAAILAMHYTGMSAAIFIPDQSSEFTRDFIPHYAMASYITGIAAVIISMALVGSTQKQLFLNATNNEKDFLNAILNNLDEGIVACNDQGKVILINGAMQKMLEIEDRDLSHRWLSDCRFYHSNSDVALSDEENPLILALGGNKIDETELVLKTQHNELRNVIVDGKPILNENQQRIGAVIALHDVTRQKQMEHQLIRQATHDMLTDLPNRLLLLDRLEQAIHQAKRTNTIVAVVFLDIDHFKLINDNFGHSAGDHFLLIVSKRLKKSVRENDTIARLGGDEFVALLTALADESQAVDLVQRILAKLSESFQIADNKLKVTVSIGISSFPKDGEDPDTLLKNADTAMYRAKAHGRNNIKFFSNDMKARTVKRLELEQYLHNALEKQEYIVHYQPIIDLHTRYIIGFEALLRWQHPTLGMLMPAEFMHLIEDNGMILSVGEWVLHTACEQNKNWQVQGLPHVRISVNVSSKQFNHFHFISVVEGILKKTQLEPKYIEIELTENSILKHPAETLNTLAALKKLGLNIALDDFGTGYSSLGYLSRLPVSKLKIDPNFVKNISDHSDNAATVLAILSMASSLKLKVTAEGIETPSELAFLRFNRCDEVQGYYFSKPLTAQEATKILKEYPKMDLSQHSSSSKMEIDT